MKEKSSSLKFKFWLFLYYPENDPEGALLAQLLLKGVMLLMSPLHDKDIKKDGTPKKPHYHCMVYFKNGLCESSVLCAVQGLASNNVVIPSYNPLKSYYYFFHKDDPDKYQYSESDCRFENGMNVELLMDSKELAAAEKEAAFNDALEKCLSGEIKSIFELSKYLHDNYSVSVVSSLAGKTYFFKSVISDYSEVKKYERMIERLKDLSTKQVQDAFASGYLEGNEEASKNLTLYYEELISEAKNEAFSEGYQECLNSDFLI